MKPVRIDIPYHINWLTASEVARQVRVQCQSGPVELNFRDKHNITPSGAVILASQVHHLGINPEQMSIPKQLANGSYAARFGLVTALGVPTSTPERDQWKRAESNHIPIAKRTFAELQGLVRGRVPNPPEVATAVALELSNRLVPGESNSRSRGGMIRPLAELVRNVFDHSCASAIWFGAQYWPRSDTAEICLADTGIGVTAGFRQSRHLADVATDEEALRIALLPGISRNLPRFGEPFDGDANAGFGLYLAAEFARSSGEFLIQSGMSRLRIVDGGLTVEPKDYLEGTVVMLRIQVSRVPEWSLALRQYLAAAESLKQYARGCSDTGIDLARRLADFWYE